MARPTSEEEPEVAIQTSRETDLSALNTIQYLFKVTCMHLFTSETSTSERPFFDELMLINDVIKLMHNTLN